MIRCKIMLIYVCLFWIITWYTQMYEWDWFSCWVNIWIRKVKPLKIDSIFIQEVLGTSTCFIGNEGYISPD